MRKNLANAKDKGYKKEPLSKFMHNSNGINSGIFNTGRERLLGKMADELEMIQQYPGLPMEILDWVQNQVEEILDNNFIDWRSLIPLLQDPALKSYIEENCETYNATIQLTDQEQ